MGEEVTFGLCVMDGVIARVRTPTGEWRVALGTVVTTKREIDARGWNTGKLWYVISESSYGASTAQATEEDILSYTRYGSNGQPLFVQAATCRYCGEKAETFDGQWDMTCVRCHRERREKELDLFFEEYEP